MFRRSQRFYDAAYSWKDYPAEAAKLHDLIQERRPGAGTLLDVAVGRGSTSSSFGSITRSRASTWILR